MGVVSVGVHHANHARLDLMTVLQNEQLGGLSEQSIDLVAVLSQGFDIHGARVTGSLEHPVPLKRKIQLDADDLPISARS